MTKAIRFHQTGGTDVLKFEAIDLPPPAAGEVRLRHTAIGVNFIDTYFRSGLYPTPLPSGLGKEVAGVIEALGEGVTGFAVGDRVATGSAPNGTYAEASNMPARELVKIPDGVSDETAAAAMLKGLTAWYLLRETYRVQKGDTILIHSAAGGVGLIACQWAKALGLQLIGTAGTDEKCALAREHGAAHVINYGKEDFLARVKDITGGKGVKVVYDSVGKDTWEKSLDCLAPFGLMASFGNASGPVPPFSPAVLAGKGSLYVTRQTLFSHIATREATQQMADDLFEAVTSGKVKIRIDQRFPLAEVRQAHEALEARKTTGCTILTL